MLRKCSVESFLDGNSQDKRTIKTISLVWNLGNQYSFFYGDERSCQRRNASLCRFSFAKTIIIFQKKIWIALVQWERPLIMLEWENKRCKPMTIALYQYILLHIDIDKWRKTRRQSYRWVMRLTGPSMMKKRGQLIKRMEERDATPSLNCISWMCACEQRRHLTFIPGSR